MAGRKTLALTDRQFEVLGLLWEHGPLTVRELLGRLPRGSDLPYTTVLGLLQTMEKAGLVTHDAEKQVHRYRPLVSRDQARHRDQIGDVHVASPLRLPAADSAAKGALPSAAPAIAGPANPTYHAPRPCRRRRHG